MLTIEYGHLPLWFCLLKSSTQSTEENLGQFGASVACTKLVSEVRQRETELIMQHEPPQQGGRMTAVPYPDMSARW